MNTLQQLAERHFFLLVGQWNKPHLTQKSWSKHSPIISLSTWLIWVRESYRNICADAFLSFVYIWTQHTHTYTHAHNLIQSHALCTRIPSGKTQTVLPLPSIFIRFYLYTIFGQQFFFDSHTIRTHFHRKWLWIDQ